jgi:wyosine [tRNA(Phe)-imidazoG37] synthetase (radical SAM superfamily)
MKAFGPVPSRRLGQSLGINNIPPKICTYSCVYCQLGKSLKMQVEREEFYPVEELVHEVAEKVRQAQNHKEHIDYLTFVPDGEPTLDRNLGKEIELLKPLGINIAIITNASLLWRDDVRRDVGKAEWVSASVNAISEPLWRSINRPHRSLHLDDILKGIRQFSDDYEGTLTTETMLIKNKNTSKEELEQIASFIAEIHPTKSYLSIPIRPPAESWAKSPDEKHVTRAYGLFKDTSLEVELLTGSEGATFAYTGDIRDDILSIAAVHPLPKEGMQELLNKAQASWEVVETLLHEKKLIKVDYKHNTFYVRNLVDMKKN